MPVGDTGIESVTSWVSAPRRAHADWPELSMVVAAQEYSTGQAGPRSLPPTELLSMDEPRQNIAAMMSGLHIHYDLGPGHPCSDGACPIWTSRRPMARSASMSSCTRQAGAAQPRSATRPRHHTLE
jgi:hypothetical protein